MRTAAFRGSHCTCLSSGPTSSYAICKWCATAAGFARSRSTSATAQTRSDSSNRLHGMRISVASSLSTTRISGHSIIMRFARSDLAKRSTKSKATAATMAMSAVQTSNKRISKHLCATHTPYMFTRNSCNHIIKCCDHALHLALPRPGDCRIWSRSPGPLPSRAPGAWRSGSASASHAEGPGFDPQSVQ